MRTWWLWSVLVGCTGKDGEETSLADAGGCDETRTPLALDEVSALGFSAADLLGRLPASETVTLTYSDTTITELALTYAPAAAASFVDLEPKPPSGGVQTLAYIVCEDFVEVEVDLTLVTADGVFDESLAGPLRATAVESASLRAELPLDGTNGTFSINTFTNETGYTDASAWVQVVLDNNGTRGDIHGQVSGEGENCEDGEVCTAWVADVPIATWGDTTER